MTTGFTLRLFKLTAGRVAEVLIKFSSSTDFEARSITFRLLRERAYSLFEGAAAAAFKAIN